jgi:hypothetical protein
MLFYFILLGIIVTVKDLLAVENNKFVFKNHNLIKIIRVISLLYYYTVI